MTCFFSKKEAGIKEVVVGLFHHQSVAASLDKLTGAKLDESLAGIVILFNPSYGFEVRLSRCCRCIPLLESAPLEVRRH
jgi:hypothetical protein